MDSWNTIKLVKFVNGIDISCSSQIDVFVQRSRDYLLGCTAHNFLQTSIDYILLGSTF